MEKSISGKLNSQPYCPVCKKLLNGFTSVDHQNSPKPGDVTVCTSCNGILQFNESMGLKLAPVEVIEKYMLEISKAQQKAKEYRAQLNFAKKMNF